MSAGGSSSTLTVRSAGGGAERGRALVEPAGQPPRRLALRAEAGQHVALRQGGQGTERAQPEPAEHVGELRSIEGGRRAAGRGRRACLPGARPGSARPPRPPGRRRRGRRRPPPARRPPIASARITGVGLGHQGVVAAEEPGRAPGREGHLAGLGDLDPRGEGVEGGDDRLEDPGITSGVVVQHEQRRAAGLRLPPPLVQDDVVGTGRRRGGHHPVGVEHGRRLVERHPGRHDRPVGAPHHQRAHRPPRSAHGSERATSASGASPGGRHRRRHGPAGCRPRRRGRAARGRRRRGWAASPRPPPVTRTLRACRWP